MKQRMERNRVRATVSRYVLTALLGALAPTTAAGQGMPAEAPAISPELPSTHWAVAAARRAEALGLLPGYLPAQRSVPRHVVRRALEDAHARAVEMVPAHAPLTASWRARFEEEFPEVASLAGVNGLRSLGSAAALQLRSHEGTVLPGRGVFPETRTGAAPLEEDEALTGRVSLALGATRHLSALVEPELTPDGAALAGWDLGIGWRRLGLSIGRQPVGYGYAAPGGLVLAGAEATDRVQLATVEPLRLPVLGSVSVHAFGGLLREPRHPGDPYTWGIAGAVQPHPRVTLSIHRAAIVGGDSVATPLTLRNFFLTFTGQNLIGFENEVVALQLRLRLPTEALLPLTIYGEWAAEDAAGAWRDVPGRLVGVFAPALPGLPEVALGAEYVAFAPSCCGNPPWYRHAPHTGNWVGEQRPLGHPLGGQGREASVYGQAELLGARLRFDTRLAARTRAGENLFVPGREGRSTAFDLRSAFRVAPGLDATAALSTDDGEGWNERRATVGIRAFF